MSVALAVGRWGEGGVRTAGGLPGGQWSPSAHEKRRFNDGCEARGVASSKWCRLASLEASRPREGEGLWGREAGLRGLPGPLPSGWSAGGLDLRAFHRDDSCTLGEGLRRPPSPLWAGDRPRGSVYAAAVILAPRARACFVTVGV